MTPRVSVLSVPILSVVIAALAVPLSAQAPESRLLTAEALACAPRLAPEGSAPAGLVLGAPDIPVRMLFGPGDPVLVSVGRVEGVSVGTQFFTQRDQSSPDPAAPDSAIRVRLTSGWLRVVEVDDHSALAVVEGTCVEVRRGDLLTPLQWPSAVSIAPEGTFDYDDAATVLFGPEGRVTLGTGHFVVIDQGTDRQIVPGQRMTIFRASVRSPEMPVVQLGEAVAVIVEATSATVLVVQARESIRRGSRVAVHR